MVATRNEQNCCRKRSIKILVWLLKPKELNTLSLLGPLVLSCTHKKAKESQRVVTYLVEAIFRTFTLNDFIDDNGPFSHIGLSQKFFA